jgi:phosphoribosyl 1,2-cyclic phosphate phosphodiesterase
MKITFLGTGTSTGVPYIGCNCEVCRSEDPRDRRLRCSSLIESDGKNILIDCGPDFRQQALHAGFNRLDAVLLTHGHFDHIGGIGDLRPFGDVNIYADKQTVASVQNMFHYCFNNTYPGIPSLIMHEIENKPFQVCGIDILPVKAYHYKLPVFGYRIGNMAYLTDFKTIEPAEEQKLLNLDVLVVDALRHREHVSHVSLKESLELIRRVAPRKAYLIHLCHDMGLHAKEEPLLPPNVCFAYDGLEISGR